MEIMKAIFDDNDWPFYTDNEVKEMAEQFEEGALELTPASN